jgi:hypothetical protein
MRFAQLIQRPGRILGGPLVRAASGGDLSLTWWPLSVVTREFHVDQRDAAYRISVAGSRAPLVGSVPVRQVSI